MRTTGRNITTADILRCFTTGDDCYAGYLSDRLTRNLGFRPTSRHVALALASMERRGFVARGAEPHGPYGYRWTLTTKGLCERPAS